MSHSSCSKTLSRCIQTLRVPLQKLQGNEDGELRKPDDFQPRHQLRLLLERGSISSDNKEALKEFSSKLVVSEKLVVEYVVHLEDLKLRRDKRTLQRKKQK